MLWTELVDGVTAHGAVGLAQEPATDALQVEDVGARREPPPRALAAGLELLEADGAAAATCSSDGYRRKKVEAGDWWLVIQDHGATTPSSTVPRVGESRQPEDGADGALDSPGVSVQGGAVVVVVAAAPYGHEGVSEVEGHERSGERPQQRPLHEPVLLVDEA